MSDDHRQQTIISEARRFADVVIRPRAAEFDREERLPREIIAELAKKKFLLASLPETDGGLGLDPVFYGFFTEEIGKACCSTRGLITVQSSLIGETLLRWGTKEQKAQWLQPIAKGEKIGAFALTEPEVGTDARGVKTAYEKSGKEYVINGRKKWISFGEIADFFILIASCRGEITAFILERDRSGIKTTPQKGLLANRAAHLAEIELRNVRLPEENVIGRPGGGFTFITGTAMGDGNAVTETTIAKYFTSKVALEVAIDAVQVHGGNGCSSSYPVERLFREAKVLEIIEGTTQIQLQIIAKYGLRKYGSRQHKLNV
jgi:alkylation response protein AidB-like acyl-CoA dehydrogenase